MLVAITLHAMIPRSIFETGRWEIDCYSILKNFRRQRNRVIHSEQHGQHVIHTTCQQCGNSPQNIAIEIWHNQYIKVRWFLHYLTINIKLYSSKDKIHYRSRFTRKRTIIVIFKEFSSFHLDKVWQRILVLLPCSLQPPTSFTYSKRIMPINNSNVSPW